MRCLVYFVHGCLSLAVIVVLHRDVHILYRELRRRNERFWVGELACLRLVLALTILVYDKMLTIIEKLAVIELRIVILISLLTLCMIDFANLTIIAVIVLRGKLLALRCRVLLHHVLHCEVALLLPLSCIFFSLAADCVLDRVGETVLLVREGSTLLRLLLFLLQ